ncbi:MAG: hypothetical protein ACHQQS_00870 [Thermoanaerobaculales bacterium]
MTDNEYLKKTLAAQTLAADSDELKALRAHRADVEALLRDKFAESTPTIRYGGSKAKGTVIKEAYDLDVICYFAHDDDKAGQNLKEIYDNVRAALQTKYNVIQKPTALRLHGCDVSKPDFHIDVVPGRFTDDEKDDAFLYRASGEKNRQKTNLRKHVEHVKDSGVLDAIRLMKLWRCRNGLTVRHFILELLTIQLLKEKANNPLTDQLQGVWTELRDNIDDLSVEDPANPTGNDLSELFDSTVKRELQVAARDTLADIEEHGWESVYGPIEEPSEAAKREALQKAPAIMTGTAKPWLPEQ